MRVFIDEFLTSGGLLAAADWGDCASLAREGAAMVQAVAADFARIEGVQVWIKRDARLGNLRFPGCQVMDIATVEEEAQRFAQMAAEADWTLVIAPEIDDVLFHRCRRVIAAGGRLLGSGLELVSLASDKHATAEFLARAGVPVPEGIKLLPGQPLPADFAYPAVLKPCHGAGSYGVRFVANARDAGSIVVDWPARLEAFCPGRPCSIALLCHSASVTPLPPFFQHLTTNGRFGYLGGERLRETALAGRLRELAVRVGAALPAARGYVGLDLVLGDVRDGSRDRVIEVNPRLTTSYLGLRRLVRNNLAAAMLSTAMGHEPPVEWSDHGVAFTADGLASDDFDSRDF